MTQVPPTTVYEIEAQREKESDTEADQGGEELCGAEQDDGSVCERPADACPYHD